jgi:hypothetical protein
MRQLLLVRIRCDGPAPATLGCVTGRYMYPTTGAPDRVTTRQRCGCWVGRSAVSLGFRLARKPAAWEAHGKADRCGF